MRGLRLTDDGAMPIEQHIEARNLSRAQIYDKYLKHIKDNPFKWSRGSGYTQITLDPRTGAVKTWHKPKNGAVELITVMEPGWRLRKQLINNDAFITMARQILEEAERDAGKIDTDSNIEVSQCIAELQGQDQDRQCN